VTGKGPRMQAKSVAGGVRSRMVRLALAGAILPGYLVLHAAPAQGVSPRADVAAAIRWNQTEAIGILANAVATDPAQASVVLVWAMDPLTPKERGTLAPLVVMEAVTKVPEDALVRNAAEIVRGALAAMPASELHRMAPLLVATALAAVPAVHLTEVAPRVVAAALEVAPSHAIRITTAAISAAPGFTPAITDAAAAASPAQAEAIRNAAALARMIFGAGETTLLK
jgi:hypothetical protein